MKAEGIKNPILVQVLVLLSKEETTPLLPQPERTLLKLPCVVHVYTKVVAHNGDISRLKENKHIHSDHPTLLKLQYARGM